ncbi:glycosyltransferase [Microbacterium sp.]|jgi:glycosyltransferase involved in cell wall biosynthesis|uniref:glycosyltransferase n=1 Tax=Microbacterium sp. TaxID=51671 RepID=UPI0037C5055D
MKILGIVTLVSPNGEYGGPLRVAVNQLVALRERGHEVVLGGAHRGFTGSPPADLEGVPAKLFPARTLIPGSGFAGLAAPGLWRAIRLHAQEFDVVHVHTARDLVTLPAARIAQSLGVRTVLQTHGMIDESTNPLAGPLDVALTRPALRAAAHVAYLTPAERASLDVVSQGTARLTELTNGVPTEDQPDRPPIPGRVLYLARLASRKRPGLFVEAAAQLVPEFPESEFVLVGPDEGEGPAVEAAIAASDHDGRIRWTGPVSPSDTAEQMQQASIFVLPSVNEPYPMSVLEAMSAGLPVIVTSTCGLASFISAHDAGIVVDETRESLVSAIRRLLADPVAAAEMGRRGHEAVVAERSMAAVAERLEQLYR